MSTCPFVHSRRLSGRHAHSKEEAGCPHRGAPGIDADSLSNQIPFQSYLDRIQMSGRNTLAGTPPSHPFHTGAAVRQIQSALSDPLLVRAHTMLGRIKLRISSGNIPSPSG